jgi:hypothetical protein
MSASNASAAAVQLSTFPVEWARPLLRLPLPCACTSRIRKLRGEDRWRENEHTDAAEDQIVQQMQQMQVSSAAGSAAAAAASSACAAAAFSSPPSPAPAAPRAGSQSPPTPLSPPATKALKAAAASSKESTPSKKSGKKSKKGDRPPLTEAQVTQRLEQLGKLLARVQAGEFAGLEIDGDSKERELAHKLAEELGLEHESLGYYPRRHLYALKPYTPDEADNCSCTLSGLCC